MESIDSATARKPRLTFWQIWNMSFGFLGIQFGFALQNANVSRIFETLGAAIDSIPILWLAAPLTGLIIQPIIGYMSDRTWNRLGRRRPYFLIGAILASSALVIMPNSPFLWVAAGMLWILDASINISMEPFRAFVGDMLPAEQRTAGFAMQSFFIGVGAVIASLLPWMMSNWFGFRNIGETEGSIPDNVKWAFYIGAAVFFLAVLWTVVSTKEYPPEDLEMYEQTKAPEKMEKTAKPALSRMPFIRAAWPWLVTGIGFGAICYWTAAEKELYVLAGGLVCFGLLLMVAHQLQKNNQRHGLVEVMGDILGMPTTMKQLAVVQFFSWFALFSMWIYTTAAVTSHIYGSSDPLTPAYAEGADWVNFLFGVYNGVAALFALVITFISNRIGRKMLHSIALLAGGMGLLSLYFITDPLMLLVSMVGVGIAWASILSIPYAILVGALPSGKFGVYMGIFNFFIVLPQIVAASILGFMVRRFFDGEPILALVAGGISMFIAGLVIHFVRDPEASLIKSRTENI